jgi:hypothetical protein
VQFYNSPSAQANSCRFLIWEDHLTSEEFLSPASTEIMKKRKK